MFKIYDKSNVSYNYYFIKVEYLYKKPICRGNIFSTNYKKMTYLYDINNSG